MTIKQIRENFDLPFLVRGMSVHVRCGFGKHGWGFIEGATETMLKVKFVDRVHTIECDPNWRITYYDGTSGDIIKKFE